MKRRFWLLTYVILVVFAFLLLTSCGPDEKWKRVEIEGCGSIKVPESWEVSTADGFMYITSVVNEKNKDVLVQYYAGGNINEYFSDIEELVWLQGECFSNSAGIDKAEARYKDGSAEEVYELYFTGPDISESTEFICTDNSISESILRRITKSFNMCE